MRLFLVFLFISVGGRSQNIFDYEREIDNKEAYEVKEIEVENTQENFDISGTLLAPKTDYNQIVIIVAGSGFHTRHGYFILAEELLKKGIAVYRFDKRGVGKSGSDYTDSATKLSDDVTNIYKRLNDLYSDKTIGIIGHSRGGMATIESIGNGLRPKFLVLIGTPVIKEAAYVINGFKTNYANSLGINVKDKSKEEVIDLFKGLFKIIAANSDHREMRIKARNLIKARGFKKKFIRFLDDENLIEVVQKDYSETLNSLEIPTLYTLGSRDEVLNVQQESDFLKSIRNPNISINIYNKLNHWLTDRNGKVGTSLYLMDQKPLKEIMDWILSLCNKSK